MKRFFAKAAKPFANEKNGRSSTSNPDNTGSTTAHTTKELQAKNVFPTVPHLFPHDHLAIVVAKDGLLVQPYIPGRSKTALNTGSTPYLRISWRTAEVVELHNRDSRSMVDWEEAVVVYGIVGVLELFSCSYLLVISSRGEVGNVIDPTHTVFSVNGVTAVPLVEDRAHSAVNALASRNAALSRPSLIPRSTSEPILGPYGSIHVTGGDPETQTGSSPRVQFSSIDDIKVMTPKLTPVSAIDEDFDPKTIPRPSSAQSFQSNISTSSSENSIATSPVFKALATRLSFWSRISKRPASSASVPADYEFPVVDVVQQPTSLAEEREALYKLMQQEGEPAKIVEAIVNATAPPPVTNEERHIELEDKVIRECIRELTKGGMYFSYNFDITRSLQHKQEQIAKSNKRHALLEGLGALPSSETGLHPPYPKDGQKVSALGEPNLSFPLWRRVDKRFWWNECMAKPFIDAGVHPYVLPIMQGYFQAALLCIPTSEYTDPSYLEGDEGEIQQIPADYIIISRRSRYRAGLRYQRRGIDEEAHVANFVETETIVRIERDQKQNVFSYVQIRGSIPLFWTQSGYSLKPPPVLASDRTHAQNLDALGRHFRRTVPLYGPHTIVNLAEQSGRESVITKNYRDYVGELNDGDIRYCEYDFHQETKGMKYENISKLVDSMEKVFATQGYLWISDDTTLSHQKGVFRVNCIDCLDRTNVVQSAFARFILGQQLSAVALLSSSVAGRNESDLIINDVWANNGDAISLAYAGTSALKGDFTRTGKRDLSGMLNDGMNSLARMYTSTFSDWFSQAVIDFMLGYRTKAVFSEFLLKLQSTDPRDLIRLSKIRAGAVATCASRVLPEGEYLRSGWTLFAPEEINVKIALKFEEKVLLLSSKALYIISYDYTLEKVKLYIRVRLCDVVGISKGAYILSPLEEASRDPEQNYGFVITWLTTRSESRTTSYSVRNDLCPILAGSNSNPSSPMSPRPPLGSGVRSQTLWTRNLGRRNTLTHTPVDASGKGGGTAEKSFAAFKVLPVDPARIRRASSSVTAYSEVSDEMQGARTCRQAVDVIVDTIHRACEDTGSAHANLVGDENIVSLAEAQRMTSVYAKMEYGVKRLLWLGG